ncbi:MAG: ATP-binding protein [Christensenellaceae bacterium]|jgi:hypothetical protein|nr:ATP-binding protein [Christensenellaceae bacterium]
MKEISLHILDLVQNSIRAEATRIGVYISEDTLKDTLSVTIEDNGCGMTPEVAHTVQNPFVTSRTTRRVGLGVPLFAAGCEHCDGSFNLNSEQGKGTTLTGSYRHSHIDRPPLGDIADTMLILIGGNPAIRFCYRHSVNAQEYELDTGQVQQLLGEVPLDSPEVIAFLQDFLKNNESELYGGIEQ